MKQYLKHYFTFSASEKRGLIILCLLIVVLSVLPIIYPAGQATGQYQFLIPPGVDSIEHKLQARMHDSLKGASNYFPFNPNTVTAADLLKLGLDNKEVEALINYRNKGGYFYHKVDFLKLYLISKEEYLALYPYIQLDKASSWKAYNKTENRIKPVEINSARVEDWQNLPGIGAVYAGRIVRYRQASGFFKSKNDLKKVYGIDTTLFQRIKPYLAIDSILLDSFMQEQNPKAESITGNIKIDLNHADTTLLKSLPGIGSYFSTKIIEYRNHLGGYVKVEQLLEISFFKMKQLESIRAKIYIDTHEIKKVSLNQSRFEILEQHPYIGRALAEYIVNRRNRVAFKSIEEIKTSFLVDDELYRKLTPYLSL